MSERSVDRFAQEAQGVAPKQIRNSYALLPTLEAVKVFKISARKCCRPPSGLLQSLGHKVFYS